MRSPSSKRTKSQASASASSASASASEASWWPTGGRTGPADEPVPALEMAWVLGTRRRMEAGNLAAARAHFDRFFQVAQALAKADPTSAQGGMVSIVRNACPRVERA